MRPVVAFIISGIILKYTTIFIAATDCIMSKFIFRFFNEM